MEDFSHTTLELLPNRAVYKKGSFFDCFYQLISGSVIVTIGHISIEVTAPFLLGDYQIYENIDYRIASIKTLTKCTLKAYAVNVYRKLNLRYNQVEKALSKFNFRNRYLQYWAKKLFYLQYKKRGEQVGDKRSIGIILEGSFKIDKNIPIVRMRRKNLQLLRKFQISLLGEGQIFEGVLVCQSIHGLVGICQQKYITQLAKQFEQFSKIIDVANLKLKMHNSLEKDIQINCRKKSKLYQHMVPLPLKDYVVSQEPQKQITTPLTKRTPSHQQDDVFRLSNNISQFLHLQWRRGLSLKIKSKDKMSPVSLSLSHSNKKYQNLKLGKLNIKNPLFAQQTPKKLKNMEQIQLKVNSINKRSPVFNSIRFKTDGDQTLNFKTNPIYFQPE